MTNICNKVIVQTFKLTLRINIHFEARKRVHRKLKFSRNNNMNRIYKNVSTKENVSSVLTLNISCEQPSFCIGMGSLSLARNFHEEHNNTYCDLHNTFLAPSLWMNLPSIVTHNPLTGLPRS